MLTPSAFKLLPINLRTAILATGVTSAMLVIATQAVANVATSTVDVSPIPVYYDLEATLEAVNQSTISAQTSGQIQKLYYDVNDRVEKGALLIEIENSQQKAMLAQARAQLAQATAQNDDAQTAFKRSQRLFKQGSISQGQYDSADAQAKSAAAAVDAAKAAVEQSQLALSYTRVKAPYSGIVKARLVEIGELVNPGQPLMSGLALTPLRAVADVPQRLASQYTNSSQIKVMVNGTAVEPTNVTLFPYADSQLHSVRLRARLQDDTTYLMPGMWTKIRLQTGQRDGLLIPQTALVERSEVTAVYVQQDGRWIMRQVRTGNETGEQVEILSGLKAGESIAVDGYAALAELAKSSATQKSGE